MTNVVSSSDSDGHVSPEGEAEPELPGALRPTAGFLSGVGHGEVTTPPPSSSSSPRFLPAVVFTGWLLVCQMQEDGSASGAFILSNPVTPALQAFPRVTNTYGSYQVTQTQQRTCSQWSRGGTGNRLFLYLLCIRMPTSHSLGPLAHVSAALVVWFTSPGPSPCTALPRPLSPLPGKNTFIINGPLSEGCFQASWLVF